MRIFMKSFVAWAVTCGVYVSGMGAGLSFVPSAQAADDVMSMDLLVIDPDPKGTNVRKTPDGKGAIVKVIAAVPQGQARVVTVGASAGANKTWLAVSVQGKDANETLQGFMHVSVLGTCSGATEDGPATWYAQPDDVGKSLGKLKQGTPLRVLGRKGSWLQVQLKSASTQQGWIMEHAVAGSLNEMESCAKKWAMGK